jgi:hypothetical protein
LVGSWGYNSAIVDGQFGLLSKDGASSFDTVALGTDDPAFADSGANGDALLTPIDASLVVNYLNVAARAEGESSIVTHEDIRYWNGALDELYSAVSERPASREEDGYARVARIDAALAYFELDEVPFEAPELNDVGRTNPDAVDKALEALLNDPFSSG